MVAIPVFRGRVAPVLDWCSKILIVTEEGPDSTAGREFDVKEDSRFGLMRTLKQQGIDTVICGALSPEMLIYGEGMGIRIIHGIAGDVGEILGAYRQGVLDSPRYWLPGCRGVRRYKGGGKCAAGLEGGGSGSGRKATGGPGGRCICPKCGKSVVHERGIPCSRLRCPECSTAMARKADWMSGQTS